MRVFNETKLCSSDDEWWCELSIERKGWLQDRVMAFWINYQIQFWPWYSRIILITLNRSSWSFLESSTPSSNGSFYCKKIEWFWLYDHIWKYLSLKLRVDDNSVEDIRSFAREWTYNLTERYQSLALNSWFLGKFWYEKIWFFDKNFLARKICHGDQSAYKT